MILYRSIRKMPTAEDASRRQYPIAETWNAATQTKGLARVHVYSYNGNYETCFQVLVSCSGPITHWRWMADPQKAIKQPDWRWY